MVGKVLFPAGDGHDGDLPGQGLAGQQLQVRPAGGQGDHPGRGLAQAGEDLEGLGTDRAGGSEQDQTLRGLWGTGT